MGDWRFFRDYAAGWPHRPSTAIIATALANAAAVPATLARGLAQAQVEMHSG